MIKKMISIVVCAVATILLFPVDSVYASDITRVIVESYTLQKVADTQIKIELNLKNTSKVNEAQSILLSFSGENDLIYPVEGESNQIYIDKISPNEITKVSVLLQVSEDVKTDIVKMNFILQYTDNFNAMASNNVILMIPTDGSGKIDLIYVNVPEVTYVNTNTKTSISCMNTGKEPIHNLQLVLSSKGLKEDVTSELISLESNQSYSTELYMDFIEEGEHEVILSYTYVDNEGNLFVEQLQSLAIAVKNVDSNDQDYIMDENDDNQDAATYITNLKNKKVEIVVIIFAVILALVLLIREYLKSKRR